MVLSCPEKKWNYMFNYSVNVYVWFITVCCSKVDVPDNSSFKHVLILKAQIFEANRSLL